LFLGALTVALTQGCGDKRSSEEFNCAEDPDCCVPQYIDPVDACDCEEGCCGFQCPDGGQTTLGGDEACTSSWVASNFYTYEYSIECEALNTSSPYCICNATADTDTDSDSDTDTEDVVDQWTCVPLTTNSDFACECGEDCCEHPCPDGGYGGTQGDDSCCYSWIVDNLEYWVDCEDLLGDEPLCTCTIIDLGADTDTGTDSDPCPGYTGSDECCLNNNPCDWALNDICDCDSTCAWDAVDCEWDTDSGTGS
jgi:hypothetical protein